MKVTIKNKKIELNSFELTEEKILNCSNIYKLNGIIIEFIKYDNNIGVRQVWYNKNGDFFGLAIFIPKKFQKELPDKGVFFLKEEHYKILKDLISEITVSEKIARIIEDKKKNKKH